jgi:hypothetical protein
MELNRVEEYIYGPMEVNMKGAMKIIYHMDMALILGIFFIF